MKSAFSMDDFNVIKNEIFIMIYNKDHDFKKELYFFNNIDDNYSRESYRSSSIIIDDLISNYKLNNTINKINILKLKYKPFLKKIPKCDKYKYIDSEKYFSLLDFEKNYYKIINYIYKKQQLYQTYFKQTVHNYKNSREKMDNMYITFITLKSLNMLLLKTSKEIDDFSSYIDEYSNSYIYKPFVIKDFKLEELSFYFDALCNKKYKKKVKYLHY